MKQLATTTFAALLAASGLATGADAAYLLVYDADTGSLTIDAQGGTLYSYVIRVDDTAPVAGFDG